MRKVLFGSLLSILLLSSCVPTKRLTYLQNEDDTKENTYMLERSLYRVQANDILSISIRTYDAETTQMYNISSVGTGGGNGALNAGDILFYLQGYSVDLQGNIVIPVIGTVQVMGKTIDEVQELIDLRLKDFFSEEAVYTTVQLAGVRYSVIGEVNRPGKYVIYQNQVNIFEALALAGDISIVGNRKEVMVVRQNPEGTETFEIDLTDSEIISDPKFFIQPNDIINVKPLPQKSFGIGTTGFQTFSQLLSVVASTITLIIAINSLNQ